MWVFAIVSIVIWDVDFEKKYEKILGCDFVGCSVKKPDFRTFFPQKHLLPEVLETFKWAQTIGRTNL